MSENQKLYRVEGRSYASFSDEYTNRLTSRESLELMEYLVVRETPKGFWIQRHPESRLRWLSKTAKRRFASQTVDGAHQDFVARKKRQQSILEARVRKVRTFIAMAELFPVSPRTQPPSPCPLP